MNANAAAFDGAKSMPRIYSRAQLERGMAIAAAASAVVAENPGDELGVHGDAIFVFARFLRAGERLSCVIILDIIFSYIGYITLLPPTYVPTC